MRCKNYSDCRRVVRSLKHASKSWTELGLCPDCAIKQYPDRGYYPTLHHRVNSRLERSNKHAILKFNRGRA